MFILYAVPLGILLGLVSGGRAAGLAEVRLRWGPLALLGLLIQVVLFLGPVADAVGWLGMPIYVGSTALVLAVVLRNVARPGLAVIAIGALSNLTAILANGGYMPASRAAMDSLGKGVSAGYSNSAVMPEPMLWPLTDIFALPREVPFANVFSVGDVLIGLGVAWALAAAMHLRPDAGEMAPRDRANAHVLAHVRRVLAVEQAPGLAAAGAGSARMATATAAGPARAEAGHTSEERAAEPTHPRGPVARLARIAVDVAWRTDLELAEWLAANVDLVGEAAGVELRDGQVLQSERPVVLAEHDGQSVVIVSERGPATDEAFGCLVRHLAACQAGLGIWICSEAADEHAATVAWLNVATGITFAMLSLEAVRIADSAPAALLRPSVRAPRAEDPRYSMGDEGRVAGAGRRAGDWVRRG